MCYLCDKDGVPISPGLVAQPPAAVDAPTNLLAKIRILNTEERVRCGSCMKPRHLDAATLRAQSRFHFMVTGKCIACGEEKELVLLAE